MKLSELQTKTQQFLQMSPQDFGNLEYSYMEALIEVITAHNVLYYSKAAPIISDSQYDQLFHLLLDLEKAYPQYISPQSPTQRLVGQISGFQKSSHRVPLLSLMNTYNTQDIENRGKTLVNSLENRGDGGYNLAFSIEPKLDGNAVEVIYKNGLFSSASTRGDGETGEDISEHAKYLLGLPLQLQGENIPELLSLRGEIVMSKQAHQRLNDYQQQEGLALFANPRNAVAGTLRNLDPRMVQIRGLSVIFYDILYSTGLIIHQHSQMYDALRVFGLPVIEKIAIVDTIAAVQDLCSDPNILRSLEKEWYETDGLVIKLEEYALRSIVGSTNHHPKRAMAYKFPSKQVVTKLLSVSYQIGRSGVITPVAELEPIQLGGVTIARASLHNFDQVEKLDLRLGDRVWVQRSGEVIPYVLGPVSELRDGTENLIQIPQLCPVCTQALVKDESYVALRCINAECPAIIKGQLKHAVGKQCLDVSGLGESLIDLLVDVGLVHSLLDLFTLQDPYKAMQLRMLPGLADKKITQILEALQQTKISALWRWIHAFGIDGVGVKTAQELAGRLAKKQSRSADDMLSAFRSFDAEEIHGFGSSLSQSLQAFAQDSKNQKLLQDLEALGVSFVAEQQGAVLSGILSGKNIVITGSFDRPRSILIQDIEALGGKVVEGVSSKVSAVLVGKDPGSKFQEAQKKGIACYSSLQEYVDSLS